MLEFKWKFHSFCKNKNFHENKKILIVFQTKILMKIIYNRNIPKMFQISGLDKRELEGQAQQILFKYSTTLG